MAEDWLADVRKYVADADEAVVKKIVNYLGIALRNRDSSLVSFSDKTETDRVRENFLKKKLALTHDDAALDAAIAGVGEQMKADRTKNRVTVYYLLARHFDLLTVFGAAAGGGGGGGAVIAGASGAAAAVGLAGTAAAQDGGGSVDTNGGAKAGDADDGKLGSAAPLAAAGLAGAAAASAPAAAAPPVAAPAPPPAPAPAPAAVAPAAPPPSSPIPQAAYSSDDGDKAGGGMGWLPWVLLALLVLALLFFGLRTCSKQEAAVAPAGDDTAISETAAPVDDTAAAVPAAAAVIPTGAGVVAAEREGKPMLTVYFDTGKTAVSNDLSTAASSVKAYIDSHSGAALAVSGYNDPTGNAAANAELSKNRAQSVKAALEKLGIAADKVVLEKPAETTTTGTDNAAARRVEVTVKG